MMRRMVAVTSCPRCNGANPAGARFCGGCGGAPLALAERTLRRLRPGHGRRNSASATAAAAPGTPARRHARRDEGERRQATVMFSDLTGYTAWNEVADPEEVEATMADEAHRRAEIERHGGTVTSSSATRSWPCSACPSPAATTRGMRSPRRWSCTAVDRVRRCGRPRPLGRQAGDAHGHQHRAGGRPPQRRARRRLHAHRRHA